MRKDYFAENDAEYEGYEPVNDEDETKDDLDDINEDGVEDIDDDDMDDIGEDPEEIGEDPEDFFFPEEKKPTYAEKQTDDYNIERAGRRMVHDYLKQDAKPTMERLTDIMRRYHEGTPDEVEQAKLDILGIMDAYILHQINTRYKTYAEKHFEEMQQSAYLGVMKGLPTYDPNRGKPTTWFSRYIDHEIQDFINKQVNHSSQHYNAAAKKINACIDRKIANNIPYTIGDIYRETNVPPKTIRECLKTRQTRISSLSATPIDYDIPSDYGDPVRHVEQEDAREQIRSLILGKLDEDGNVHSVLTKEEQQCIILQYGLDGEEGRSLVDIEEITGIPRYRVNKIVATALKKLKAELGKEHRAELCKQIRRQVETNIRLGGELLTVDEMVSDQEAVAMYDEMGLLN